MNFMKIHLFVVADPYETRGWNILAVEESNKWALEHNLERDDSELIKTLNIDKPSNEILVRIGLAKVDEMKEDMAKQNMANTQRVKEFESKFLALDAPMDVDELS